MLSNLPTSMGKVPLGIEQDRYLGLMLHPPVIARLNFYPASTTKRGWIRGKLGEGYPEV